MTQKEKILLLSLLFIPALSITALTMLPRSSFWISDCGNKFIQTENFLKSGRIDIEYPAKDIDKEMNYFPYCGHHFFKKNDKIYSFYPAYFPLISAPLYKICGFAGLYILPALSALAIAILTILIMKSCGIRKWLLFGALASILITPLVFYGMVFWEETPAVALSALAFLITLKAVKHEQKAAGLFLSAGFLLALSTILREEGYILFAALSAALLFQSRNLKYCIFLGLGFALGIVPIWIFQYSEWRHILGPHFQTYSEMEKNIPLSKTLISKLTNFYVYMLRFTPDPRIAGAFYGMLLFPFLAAALTPFIPNKKMRDAIPLSIIPLAATASIINALILLKTPDIVFSTIFTQSLLPFMPFIVLPLAYSRKLWSLKNPALKLLLLTTAAYCLLTPLALNQRDIGIIWGPRHFLFIIPAVLVLSLASFKFLPQTKVIKSSIIMIMLASLLIECGGLHALYIKKEISAKITDKLESMNSEYILSDIFWLPEDAARLFFSKKFMMPGNSKGNTLSGALKLLRSKGIGKATIVLSNQYRRISDKDLKEALDSVEVNSWQELKSPALPFMTITVFACSLEKSPPQDQKK